MSIEDKLKKLVIDLLGVEYGGFFDSVDVEAVVPQIIQVFRYEGWTEPPQGTRQVPQFEHPRTPNSSPIRTTRR